MTPARVEWRCGTCGKLLGVHRGLRIEIKHEQSFYMVTGTVCAVCRGCRSANYAESGAPDARLAG